jgi:hypothetical protein
VAAVARKRYHFGMDRNNNTATRPFRHFASLRISLPFRSPFSSRLSSRCAG